jgi:hypothetical protein
MKAFLAILALALSSCALGPDWSPDVAGAANYNGSTPVFDTNGRMMGMSAGSPRAQHRSTMLTP